MYFCITNVLLFTYSLPLEDPILWSSFSGNDCSGSFFVGPSFGYLIKDTYSIKEQGNYITENKNLGNSIPLSNYDFNLVLGVGGDMKALGGKIGLDVRYSFGLTSIINGSSISNGTISASLYYLFNDVEKESD